MHSRCQGRGRPNAAPDRRSVRSRGSGRRRLRPPSTRALASARVKRPEDAAWFSGRPPPGRPGPSGPTNPSRDRARRARAAPIGSGGSPRRATMIRRLRQAGGGREVGELAGGTDASQNIRLCPRRYRSEISWASCAGMALGAVGKIRRRTPVRVRKAAANGRATASARGGSQCTTKIRGAGMGRGRRQSQGRWPERRRVFTVHTLIRGRSPHWLPMSLSCSGAL